MAGWQELLARQAGMVHRRQAIQAGMTDDEIRHRVRRGSWPAIYPGVYATLTGPLPFASRVWAALLHAGPPAMASHRTAARLQGLIDEDPAMIQISVPNHHRVTPQAGLRVHRPRAWSARKHPGSSTPVTRVEDTVLDLIGATRDPDEVVSLVLRACQRRLTTPGRLGAAAGRRRRLRHRGLLRDLVTEVAGGVASPLERRYRLNVELAHGLPKAERGRAWIGPDGVRRYFDARYRLWRVRIELEGLAYHPLDRSWVDHERDNAAVLVGDVVLRYGWRAVTSNPCQVAAQVAAVLTLRGWPGPATPCGPACRVSPRPGSGARVPQ
jgi:hypothetical protein